MTDDDLDKLRAATEIAVPRCASHDGRTCDRCARAMVVDGYIQTLRECRIDVDARLARAVPALLDEIGRLRARPWERLRDLGYEVDETGLRRGRAMEREIVQLRAMLAEAIYIFNDTWCTEHGHSPKPEQIARMEELQKLVADEVNKIDTEERRKKQL